MSIQTKVFGLFICIPLLLEAQGSSSCRRAAPTNTSTPNANNNLNNNKNMNNASNAATQDMPAGTWGGNHISIVVGAGGAKVEYDCAHGSISPPLALDDRGRFDLRGTYTPETPGPTRIGKASEGRPVKYEGRIEGKQMTLKVTPIDNSEPLGEFTLTHGSVGRIRKCQ